MQMNNMALALESKIICDAPCGDNIVSCSTSTQIVL